MAIEELVEEVASNFDEVAEATRKINAAGLSYFGIGVGVGLMAGIAFGYRLNREKLRAEAIKDAEDEISQIREFYLQKVVAADNMDKPSVESIVAEHGYSVKVDPVPERALPAPVPILNDLPTNAVPTSKSKNAGWSYANEVENRSADKPYVIHQDEYETRGDFTKSEYAYYEEDSVLMDTDDMHPIPHADVIVGETNLKWGHGSDDADVVYVRNDRLNTDMRITRLHKSYEEDVLGMSRDDVDDPDSD